jgi:hypothetical protein
VALAQHYWPWQREEHLVSLPTNPKAAWPPAEARPVVAEVSRLDAWYSGDRDRIRNVTQPGDLRSALQAARSPSNNASNQLVVPLAGDIARTSADLLFSETPAFTTEDAAQERLDDLLDLCSFDSALLEQAELCAALSGIYWRVGFDTTVVRDRPIVSWVQPDSAVPEWRWGVLTAVTFWSVLPRLERDADQTVWRHLERHSSTAAGAVIENGLYFGTEDKLGQPMPLADHPDTAGIAAALASMDEAGDGQVVMLPGVPMTAGYVPNMRPNRSNRRSLLGRADIDGLFGVLNAVNQTWTSWIRDLRLARARLIVPEGYLQTLGRGQGASFDMDQELFQPVAMPPKDQGGDGLTLVQFNIRVAEHSSTLEGLVRQAVTSAGYSLQTFGLADASAPGAATATEIRSRERLSMITRERKTRYWGDALRGLLFCLLAVDRHMNNPDAVEPADVQVEFGDSISEDPKVTAETANLLFQAQAATIDTRVRMVHPDWDDERVAQEVAGIMDETGSGPVPNPDPGELTPGQPVIPVDGGFGAPAG